jgi:hypothetical protein
MPVDDHVSEADSEDEKEDTSNTNLFQVDDACAIDTGDDHVSEEDSEDYIQGDDECTAPPLIKANPRRDILRAFLFDDDNNDTNHIDSEDDCSDLDSMSMGSQSLGDTWDDTNCYTDSSLVDTAKYSTAQIAAKNLYSRFCSKTHQANTVHILQDLY